MPGVLLVSSFGAGLLGEISLYQRSNKFGKCFGLLNLSCFTREHDMSATDGDETVKHGDGTKAS